jgi:hypothetical protein
MVDVVQAAKAEAVTVKAKIKAWAVAHIPHASAAAVGFVVSHFGVIPYLVKKFI